MIGSRLGPKLALEHKRTSDYYGVWLPEPSPTTLVSAQVVSRLIGPASAGGLACPGKILAESRYVGVAFIQEKIDASRQSTSRSQPTGATQSSRPNPRAREGLRENSQPVGVSTKHGERLLSERPFLARG